MEFVKVVDINIQMRKTLPSKLGSITKIWLWDLSIYKNYDRFFKTLEQYAFRMKCLNNLNKIHRTLHPWVAKHYIPKLWKGLCKSWNLFLQIPWSLRVFFVFGTLKIICRKYIHWILKLNTWIITLEIRSLCLGGEGI